MIPLFVLFAFIPTGLIGAIVDTVYLHRLKAAIRASGSAAPLDAMLRPPRHRLSDSPCGQLTGVGADDSHNREGGASASQRDYQP